MKYRWIEIIVHGLFWILSAWFLISSFSVQLHEVEIVNGIETIRTIRNNDLLIQLLFCVFIGALQFYFILFWFKQKNEVQSKLWWYVLLIYTSGVAFFELLRFLHVPETNLHLPRAIAHGTLTFYTSVALAYALATLSYRNTMRQHQLLIDKKQTELMLLRKQLEPHFLFNALNNLLSMVSPNDNPQLHHSIEKLSHMLRYVIDETKLGSVTMQQEISFLKNYVELVKLRFNEDELNVPIDVAGDHLHQRVEPGIFITFVENAFRYGTEPEKNATIHIHFDLTSSDRISFRCVNKVFPHQQAGNGTGIQAARKRLDLIYPEKHSLTISKTDEFRVRLVIQTA